MQVASQANNTQMFEMQQFPSLNDEEDEEHEYEQDHLEQADDHNLVGDSVDDQQQLQQQDQDQVSSKRLLKQEAAQYVEELSTSVIKKSFQADKIILDNSDNVVQSSSNQTNQNQ